jgi:hypothetical protein
VSVEPRLALNHFWKEAPPLPDKERGFSISDIENSLILRRNFLASLFSLVFIQV